MAKRKPQAAVPVTEEFVDRLEHIARAITPVGVPGTDAAGGSVMSLTEAVMGITAGLFAVAEAINNLAEADKKQVSRLVGKDLGIANEMEEQAERDEFGGVHD